MILNPTRFTSMESKISKCYRYARSPRCEVSESEYRVQLEFTMTTFAQSSRYITALFLVSACAGGEPSDEASSTAATAQQLKHNERGFKKHKKGHGKGHGKDDPPTAYSTWTAVGSGIQRIGLTDVEFLPGSENELVAAAGTRIYLSDDVGETWYQVANLAAHVRDLSVDSSQILAATANGVRASSDGGLTWSTKSLNGLGVDLVQQVSPTQAFVYGSGGPILRTSDGGATWRSSRSDQNEVEIFSVINDRANPKRAIAAATHMTIDGARLRTGALLASDNGGATWRSVLSGADAHDVTQCPSDPQHWLAGVGDTLQESRDGGRTWTLAHQFKDIVTSVAFIDAGCEEQIVYEQRYGFLRSLDGGTSWIESGSGPVNFPSLFRFAIAPDGETVITFDRAGAGAFRSNNRGASWTPLSGPGDIRLTSLATLDNRLIVGTWGSGVWSLEWGEESWSPIHEEPRFSFFALQSPLAQTYIGGWPRLYVQDDNNNITMDTIFFNPRTVSIDPNDSAHIVIGTQNRGVQESVDAGATWAPINEGLALDFNTNFAARLEFSKDSEMFLITSAGYTYRRTHGGEWHEFGGDFAHGIPSSLRMTLKGPRLIVQGQGIARLTQGQWQPYNSGLSDLNVADLHYDESTGREFLALKTAVYELLHDGTWTKFKDTEVVDSNITALDVIHSIQGAHLLIGTTSDGVYSTPLD